MAVHSRARDEAVATDSLDRLRVLSGHRDKSVRAAVAANPASPTHLLNKLVADKHHLVRYAVAQRADREAWRVALAAEDFGVRVILAQRHDLDGETLEALFTDPQRRVRESLAESSRRTDVISRLAKDADQHVRACAALSDFVSDADLERLAADRIARVRAVAAQHPRLDESAVSRLSLDRSATVRYFVLEHHRQRLDIAERLEDDADEGIRRLARVLLAGKRRATSNP